MIQYVLSLGRMDAPAAIRLTKALAPSLYAVKIHDLYDAYGRHIINDLKDAGAKLVWVDMKIEDTPHTARDRAKAFFDNGADILTVHISGGIPMMQSALEVAGAYGGQIWGVTVLSSLDEEESKRLIDPKRRIAEIVYDRTLIAKEAGIRTVVCSVQEVGILSSSPKCAGMQFAVTGTRLSGIPLNGQKRSGSPVKAVLSGATYLILGGEVTRAIHPTTAFKKIEREVFDQTAARA